MTKTINLNADIAEGWGAYEIGNDAELMKIIKSASVACGFHAGDPNTMHRLCMLAKQEGVSVGVHPGFNDLWGFGRRRIQMKPSDLEYMIAYQIGALQAMASYAGQKVTHLKPHGALNNMAAEDEAYAWPLAGPSKPSTGTSSTSRCRVPDGEGRAKSSGCASRARAFPIASMTMTAIWPQGPLPGAVLKDPKAASEQALRMVRDGEIVSTQRQEGEDRRSHTVRPRRRGDWSRGRREIRRGLENAGIAIVPLTHMEL